MYYLFVAFCVALLSTACSCEKLTCNDVTADETVPNITVWFDLCTVNFDFCGTVENKDDAKLQESLQNLGFDPQKKTVVIVHGFTNRYTWMHDMAQSWLQAEPANIFAVRWPNNYIKQFNYRKAALLTETVAFETANFLLKLYWSYDNLNTTFHIVGHSLGAHAAGQAGRLLRAAGLPVQRITGLDPAHPCFEDNSASLRLRKTDAKFIDVIHTNGDRKNLTLGTHEHMGTIDFYVNGGNMQPECENERVYLTEATLNSKKHEDQLLFMNIFNCENIYENPELRDLRKTMINILKQVQDQIPEDMKSNQTYLKALISQATQYIAETNMGDILENAFCTNSFCNHGAALTYFKNTFDESYTKNLAHSVGWPVNVTTHMRCQNRQCYDLEAEINCVPMGLGVQGYVKATGPFYLDTTDDVLDCTEC